MSSLTNQHNWHLRYTDYVGEKQGLREALLTLGNGFFATRGAFIEAKADESNYPGTYLAGGYNRLKTEIFGKVIENEDLVNIPNWLCLNFRIDEGQWFGLQAVKIHSFEQSLTLKEGLLKRKVEFTDALGRRTALQDERLVHMRLFHLAAIQLKLVPLNWSGTIEVVSALDGRVENQGVARYRKLNGKHLKTVSLGVNDNQDLFLTVQTSQSLVYISQSAKNRVYLDNQLLAVDFEQELQEDYVARRCQLSIKEGQELTVEKVVSLYTSKDHAITSAPQDSQLALTQAPSFSELAMTQKHAWHTLWKLFDIAIETADKINCRPLLILRLHIFHLLQTVNYSTLDLDVGVPARGWHGEAYRGHIFWDELFILPLLTLRLPKVSLALLKYRYRRLNAARMNARESGFEGAMYPWQSGSNGREESQKVHLNPESGRWIPDNSSLQRHVSLAIAYNCYRYFEITNDMDFLRSYGAEMMFEICRFFASLCEYDQESGRYSIDHVMGPDEYHDAYPGAKEPGLKNNAYTNFMAVSLFCNALELLRILPKDHLGEITELLDLKDQEIQKWEKISKKMKILFHDDMIISQFEGYEKLEEFDWESYKEKYGDIQRLDRILESEGDTTNHYKVSKQADVLMLFYLFSADEIKDLFQRLGYHFQAEAIPKNVLYYLKRTAHGSTLSRVVHSWVLSREDRVASWKLFVNALESDVADIQGGTTEEGIHLGSMAGTVDIIERCYTGIEPKRDALWFNPCLPDELKSVDFRLHYRDHSLEITVNQKELKVVSREGFAKPISIGFKGTTEPLSPGDEKIYPLSH